METNCTLGAATRLQLPLLGTDRAHGAHPALSARVASATTDRTIGRVS